MKKCYLLLLLLTGLVLNQCTEKYPKEINRPEYGLENTKTLEIDKVILTDSATVLYIDAYFPAGNWIRIDSATYLLADGKKYIIESSDSINLNEEFYMPESGEAHFTLTFPPLPKGTKSFDFIESDCDNCFKIWDVNITGKPQKYTPDMPEEILGMKVNKDATYPDPEFKTGKTKVTLYLTGLKDGYAINNVLLLLDNIFIMDRTKIEAVKESDGKYVFEADQYATAHAMLVVGGKTFPLLLVPGEEAEIYIDMTAESKHNNRYNPKKDLRYIIHKGELANINNQLAEMKIEHKDTELITPYDTAIVNMSKEQFLDKLFDSYNKKLAGTDTLGLTFVQKEYVKNNLKNNAVMYFNGLPGIYTISYRMKNKLEWDAKIDYTPPKITDEDMMRLKDLDLGNKTGIYSSSYTYTILPFAINIPEETLNRITGTETGLLQDLHKSIKPIIKGSNMIALTPEEEKELASASSPYYTEIYKNAYNSSKKQYDESLAKGGFIIEEAPKTTDDKILDAIIAKYKGKPVFVDFWATWCGPCLSAMKTIKPIKGQINDKGVVSIYISSTTSPRAEWISKLSDIGGIHYYLNDSQWSNLSKKYNMRGIPSYMIFDKTGKKTFQQSGYPGNDRILDELSKVW